MAQNRENTVLPKRVDFLATAAGGSNYDMMEKFSNFFFFQFSNMFICLVKMGGKHLAVEKKYSLCIREQ